LFLIFIFNQEAFMKKEKKLVMPTEVYSRIVGYYRPIQNWNDGKKQEFSERNTYNSCLKEPKSIAV